MRPLAFRLRTVLAAALVVASGAFTPAHAQWMDVATISSTLGNTPYRLCMGGGRTDIGCPADAPLLDRTLNRLTVPTDLRVMGNLLVSGSQSFDGVTFANGGVSATGTISATSFSGDGSGITGIDFSSNPVDRIISGTAAVIAQQGGTVGLTLGGVANVAYFHPTLGFVGPGVSSTGPVAGMTGYFSGDVGIGTTAPNAKLDVYGTISATNLRLSGDLYVSGSQTIDGVSFNNGGISATGTISATGFSGDGSGLTGIDFGSNPVDRIVSGTAAVIAKQAGTVGLTLGGTPDAAYFHPTLGFVGPGVSSTGPISGTQGYFSGNMGLGTVAPKVRLDVAGTLRMADGGEQCDADRMGAIKFLSGSFYICQNGSAWEQMATTSSNTLVSINTGLSGSIVFRDELGYLKARSDFHISSTTGSVGLGAGAPAWLGDNGVYAEGAIFADKGFIMDSGRRIAWGDNTTRIQGTTFTDDQHIQMAVMGNEAMRIVSTGYVGIGTAAPSTTLDVRGMVRMATSAAQCDANRVGAMKYESGQFMVCRNGSTWEYMVAGNSGSVDADRITSGTTAVMAHRDASVTISTGGLERVTIGTGGNVGIGVAIPERPLTVLGTVSVTMLNLGSDGTPCTATERGTIKFEGNKMFMCRD